MELDDHDPRTGALRTHGARATAASPPIISSRPAEVAQLVAQHLAKVWVAGSSPVFRSAVPVRRLALWFACSVSRALCLDSALAGRVSSKIFDGWSARRLT